MSKVKKRPVAAGVRNTRRTGTSEIATVRKALKKTQRKQPKSARAATSKRPARGSDAVSAKARAGRLRAVAPVARYDVKPLDPFRKCGPDTSVQFLYLVQETVEGKKMPHLVFFDHHGWYCLHGRMCPAVAPARKYNGHVARVS